MSNLEQAKKQMIQSILDHVLSTLGEECGEVQQVLGKISRFGLEDVNPKTETTHWEELRKEMHDIVASWELVCEELDRSSGFNQDLITLKKRKVKKYMQYAADRGRLQLNK